MTQRPLSDQGDQYKRPARYGAEWVLCEDTGRHADGGECPVHGGDACLIVVAWVDRSSVRMELAKVRSKLWLAEKALEDCSRHTDDERLQGVIRVTLENARQPVNLPDVDDLV